jgi:hypothetical protein
VFIWQIPYAACFPARFPQRAWCESEVRYRKINLAAVIHFPSDRQIAKRAGGEVNLPSLKGQQLLVDDANRDTLFVEINADKKIL